MSLHKVSLATYYTVLVAAVLFQAVSTVYNLSQTMSFGSRVQALQSEQQALLKQKTALTNEAMALTSVATLEKSETAFVAIASVTPLEASAFLASR